MTNKYFESDPESDEPRESIISVSDDERLTVPKWVQEELGIDTPGKVQFRKTKSGEIVIENVSKAGPMRGYAKRHGTATTDKPATQLLQEDRERDKESLDTWFNG